MHTPSPYTALHFTLTRSISHTQTCASLNLPSSFFQFTNTIAEQETNRNRAAARSQCCKQQNEVGPMHTSAEASVRHAACADQLIRGEPQR